MYLCHKEPATSTNESGPVCLGPVLGRLVSVELVYCGLSDSGGGSSQEEGETSQGDQVGFEESQGKCLTEQSPLGVPGSEFQDLDGVQVIIVEH